MQRLKLLKELPGDKVEVEDIEGQRWIVGRQSYDKFKKTGFLHVPKEMALAFSYALNGRSYEDLSKQEQYDVMTKIIVAATKEPLETFLPHLASL